MVKQLPPQNYVDPLIVISVTIKRGVKIGVHYVIHAQGSQS